ncbi:MAG: hypothetical protein H7346_09735 [Burkholderiaceae bacterium]|nr:hypothetical protein [Burkholderiaceae bacterium]
MTDSLWQRRVGVILEQCAVLAKCIQQLAIDGASDKPHMHELACIELLAAQLGYHADLGSAQLGREACFGDAEDWMLPPAYFV